MNAFAFFVMAIFLESATTEDKVVEEPATVEESVTITVTE
jgi:hypothetical protein